MNARIVNMASALGVGETVALINKRADHTRTVAMPLPKTGQ